MLAIFPVLFAAFAGLVSATTPNVTSLTVSNIDNFDDIWSPPNPGKVSPRGADARVATRAPKNPNSPRLLNCHGVMRIKDDEVFSDDYFTRTTNMEFILGVSHNFASTQTWIEKAGGEIRIEVLLTATLNPNNGAITLRHYTKLFEGASTSTNDLDGTGQGSMVVAKNGQKVMAFTVNNTDEGGDWVKVTLTCTNSKVR